MTHEQVMALLPPGAHHRASIWRILADLTACGLLRRMDLGDRIWRFALQSRLSRTDQGHYFLCRVCAEVTPLPPLELRTKEGTTPAVLHNIEYQVRMLGRCGKCD